MAKKTSSRIKDHPNGLHQTDYVEHGSEQHAAIIGLRLAGGEDTYVREDSQGRKWTLVDVTAFGPQVTEAYIREVLRQKVSTLDAPPLEVQSDDPFAPNYAPPLDLRYEWTAT
jgi:hypothetical protein